MEMACPQAVQEIIAFIFRRERAPAPCLLL
jgi:hypothetical protein